MRIKLHQQHLLFVVNALYLPAFRPTKWPTISITGRKFANSWSDVGSWTSTMGETAAADLLYHLAQYCSHVESNQAEEHATQLGSHNWKELKLCQRWAMQDQINHEDMLPTQVAKKHMPTPHSHNLDTCVCMKQAELLGQMRGPLPTSSGRQKRQ